MRAPVVTDTAAYLPGAEPKPMPLLSQREWAEGRATTVAGLRLSDAPYAAYVERVLAETVKWGEVTNSPYSLEQWVLWIARRSYTKGREMALLELRTSPEAADELGVHRTTVFRWAREMELGWHIGRDLVLTGEDVEKMRGLRR